MSLVTGYVVGVVILLVGSAAITAFGIYLRVRDAREQEQKDREPV